MKSKFLILSLLILTACASGDENESSTLLEARETYSRMMKIAEESADIAQGKMEDLKIRRDSVIAQGDSLLASNLNLLNSRLDSLHSSLESWKHQAQEMRAHSKLKEEGDSHEHHHHDHSVDYSEFNEEQLLELQLEMEKQVKSLNEQINSIETEIEETNAE